MWSLIAVAALGMCGLQDPAPVDSLVHVHPTVVAEIAFDEIQKSPRHDSGFALRFARGKRFRPDQTPAQADTIANVAALHH